MTIPVAASAQAATSTASARQNLRVALIRQKFRFDGGGERIVTTIADILRANGHHVSLIARKWDCPGSNVIACDPSRWTRIQRESRFAAKALELTRQHKFDLVQSHERIPGCQIYRAGDGVHQVWLEQRTANMGSLRRSLLARSGYHKYMLKAERDMFEHSALRHVICNAQMVADEIVDRFQIDPSKISVIHNGVDTTRFHPATKRHRESIRRQFGIAADQPLALFVGSGWERKGLGQLLKSMAAVENVSAIVVGRDKSKRQFEKLATRLGIANRVHFAGTQPDVAPFYGAADCFILPTLYDPFPNAVMEAMACGLPVITSHKCGAVEMIESGVNGYIIRTGDSNGWADVLQACTDHDHACRLGLQARKTIEPYHTERMLSRLNSLYQQLLTGTPAQGHSAA